MQESVGGNKTEADNGRYGQAALHFLGQWRGKDEEIIKTEHGATVTFRGGSCFNGQSGRQTLGEQFDFVLHNGPHIKE